MNYSSSPDLRDKRELIMNFNEKMTPSKENYDLGSDVTNEWNTYMEEQKEKELQSIISEEKLRPKETRISYIYHLLMVTNPQQELLLLQFCLLCLFLVLAK